ncbi:hypothetical protein [Paracoccus sp. Ld10]|uniref:hypothetical protein n=1 Tax=Paracoccus sp. Ld10 TaxID=649158 RepID=UPI00386900FE
MGKGLRDGRIAPFQPGPHGRPDEEALIPSAQFATPDDIETAMLFIASGAIAMIDRAAPDDPWRI